jgi:hypothetical protein
MTADQVSVVASWLSQSERGVSEGAGLTAD